MKKMLLFSFLTLFLIISTPTLKADTINTKPEDDTKLRWYEDKIIYDGEVNVNEWATLVGDDDESIDIDYFAGDTLRAVVACPDSTLRIFRSNDNGQTWLNVQESSFGGSITEPRIVHGPDSTYHIFVRYRLYVRRHSARRGRYSGPIWPRPVPPVGLLLPFFADLVWLQPASPGSA